MFIIIIFIFCFLKKKKIQIEMWIGFEAAYVWDVVLFD